MHPWGSNPRRPTTAPYGAGGFRDGSRSTTTNAPPYGQQPPPPQQQMTPQKREQILMAAGRLAAEYLVSKGELPAHVLRNRPPPALPFQERPPVPRPQHYHHGQTSFPRSFQQERPLANQHFQFRPPAPRQFQFQFQQRPSSFAPRPFQGQGRPIDKRPRSSFQWRRPVVPHPAGPLHSGARAPAPSVTQGDLNDAPAAGDGNDSQHAVAQSGDAADTAQSSQQMMDQPNQD